MSYPTLNPVSVNCGGGPLTLSMVETAIRHMADPERIRREAGFRAAQEEALNLRLKTYWAKLHGKTVEALTPDDMSELCELMFQSWLKYKGITEQDFRDFFGF